MLQPNESNDKFSEYIITTGTVTYLGFSNLINNYFTRTSDEITRAEQ